MKTTRFVTSVVKTAQEQTPQMPWARGARRAAFIAKRKGALELRKTA